MCVGVDVFLCSPLCSCFARFPVFHARSSEKAQLTLGVWLAPPGWGPRGFRTAQGHFRWLAAGAGGHRNAPLELSIPAACRSSDQKQHVSLLQKGIFAASPHWPLKCTPPLVYLGKFDVSRVSYDPSVGLFVACVTNELTVPHSIVMFAICSLRKYGNGWPVKQQKEKWKDKKKYVSNVYIHLKY